MSGGGTALGFPGSSHSGSDSKGFYSKQEDYAGYSAMSDSTATRRTSSFQQRIPIVLTWTHLTFTVDLQDKNEKLTILNDVSGFAEPGKVTAIMGSSGAGKTTLLNLLSGRQKGFTGDVLFNGKRSSPAMERRVAYCYQTDLFYQMLTVREHLQFQARLRMDAKIDEKVREEHVEYVMEELQLTKVATHRIGRVGHGGISGGERRRLTFASEILTDPSLLFLDEPTSGLDSHLAESIVSELRNLARGGRTICSTIHQPSSLTFAMFDNLFLMSEGRVAYAGSLKDAPAYFSALGHQVPPYINPADFYISELSVLQPPRKEESQKKIRHLLSCWEGSKQYQQLIEHNEKMKQEDDLQLNAKDFKVSRFKASLWTQLRVLMHRNFIVVHRDPMLTKATIIRSLVISIMAGLIYFQQGNNQSSVQNKEGVVFYILIYQSIGCLLGVLHTFPEELPLFLREYGSNMYQPGPYYLSVIICAMPMQIIASCLFITIAYWMIDLNPDPARYGMFMLVVVLIGLCACATGDMVSTLAPSVQTASALSPLVIMPLMIFGGFFLNAGSVPVYFIWLQKLTFVGYGFEVLMVIVWSGVTLTCDADEQDICFYHTGEEVLSDDSFSADNFSRDIWAIVLLGCAWHICAWLFLWRRAVNSREKNGDNE